MKNLIVRECKLFKGYCPLDFIMSLREFKCYTDKTTNYIILQFGELSNIVLDTVDIVYADGTLERKTLKSSELNLDKKYLLYELQAV